MSFTRELRRSARRLSNGVRAAGTFLACPGPLRLDALQVGLERFGFSRARAAFFTQLAFCALLGCLALALAWAWWHHHGTQPPLSADACIFVVRLDYGFFALGCAFAECLFLQALAVALAIHRTVALAIAFAACWPTVVGVWFCSSVACSLLEVDALESLESLDE